MTKDSAAPLCEEPLSSALLRVEAVVMAMPDGEPDESPLTLQAGDVATLVEEIARLRFTPPQEAVIPTEGARTVSQVVSDWKATGERVVVDTGYDTPTRGEAEPVAWLTTGGDVTRSHAYAVEQSVNDPNNYPVALVRASQPHAPDSWRPIETYEGCGAVLVGRPTDSKLFYRTASAFRDVTGVWRILFSEGGMAPLPYEPTVWQPLPAPPSQPKGEER